MSVDIFGSSGVAPLITGSISNSKSTDKQIIALTENLATKVSFSDLETKADITSLETKADKTDLATLTTTFNAKLVTKVNQIEQIISDNLVAVTVNLATKANISDLADKLDLEDFHNIAATKLKLKELKDQIELDMLDLASIADLETKANSSDLELKADASELIKKIDKLGGTITGDLYFNLANDLTRSFGVTDISAGKSAVLIMGSILNSIILSHNNHLLISADKGTKFTCASGDTCLLGGDADAKAEFFQDILMNDKTITSLRNPSEPTDAATKLYVDNEVSKTNSQISYIKSSIGLVPSLTTSLNKNGFVTSASNNTTMAFHAFNAGSRIEYKSLVTTNFWIRIDLPEPSSIYKMALTGRLNERIFKFKFQGLPANSPQPIPANAPPANAPPANAPPANAPPANALQPTETDHWDDLTPIIDKHIGPLVQFFQITNPLPFSSYRLFVLEAERPYPILYHWQLYPLERIYRI